MAATHALSIDITLSEKAAEGASASVLSNQPAAEGRADGEAAPDTLERGFYLDLFGEKIVQAKTSRRKRYPQGDGEPQPSTLVPSATAEVDPESTRPTESPSSASFAQETPAAAEAPSGQHPGNPEDGDNEIKVDPQSASMWTTIETFDLRGDDLRIESLASLFKPHPNGLKIYRALFKLADDQQKGTRVNKDTWRIKIGYGEIGKESGCSKRTLGRAWPRLERLAVVVCIEKHMDRCENLYLVRSPEWLERMYKESGCTHFRIVEGLIQPFRPRSEGKK